MLILAVDTTTSTGSVALIRKGKLLSEMNIDSTATYSERLLPAIDEVLETQQLSIRDIEAFAIAAGPGSFTGIRIGISAMKSLAYASGKPIVAVSSLKALALKLCHPHSRLLCPLLDARKGEIYAALFEFEKRKLNEVVPQGIYSPDLFFSLLPSRRIIFFIGNGVAAHQRKIFQYFKDKARISSRSPFIAYEVGVLGYEILKNKESTEQSEIEPIYFRKSQAEEGH
jgi:tRNA threonylcarbamoyladenosine biosynthesis protein TsaB